jgi:hypothetical protein
MISSNDPQRACAVLVGTSEYADEDWEPLPAVRRNIASLTELLCSPRCWVPPRNVTWVVDEDAGSNAEERIKKGHQSRLPGGADPGTCSFCTTRVMACSLDPTTT